MVRKYLLWFTVCAFAVLLPMASDAQETEGADEQAGQGEYFLGVVEEVRPTTKVKILKGKEKGSVVEINDDVQSSVPAYQTFNLGQKVIVTGVEIGGQQAYFITDHYRLWPLAWILIIFFALVFVCARWRGLASLLGLVVSILILIKFVVPQILQGRNPLLISLVGALLIAVFSIYPAHGFNKRTSVALLSTIVTLGVSAGVAIAFVQFAHLFGVGSEETFFLTVGPLEDLNLKGLLLGGIIIGTLGVLDDVTTTQTATVAELLGANPDFSRRELMRRAMVVGREHITALVNTLALAYAGVALPLFLLFSVNEPQPLWVIVNGEMIAEELIRTLVGSSALVLGVPLSTLFATLIFKQNKLRNNDSRLK